MSTHKLLIDLDGVLRIGSKPAERIQDFLDFISTNSIEACILSNTTSNTSENIQSFFSQNGINLHGIPTLTALDATYQFVKEKYSSIKLYAPENVAPVFSDIPQSENPEAVVLGDLEDDWDYQVMNDIFKKVHHGAEIVAMQKNRYWVRGRKGLSLDAGAFISGIEFATGKEAIVVGKPSPVFFHAALKMIDTDKGDDFFMLGDDLVNDVKAAQDIGGTGVLILTGKTDRRMLKKNDFEPNFIVEHLSELEGVLQLR